ncbi:MAG: hypothetical protein FWD27_07305 [Coriobacteriia bacterium]|nr:hypothetical protein [Coriobacteriia bacterium]
MNKQTTQSLAASAKATHKMHIINPTLFSYFIRRQSILLAVIALCVAAYSAMIIAMWPLFIDEGFQETMELLAASLPGMDTQSFLMTLGEYLETQWLGAYLLPLAGAALIVFAARAIAGSISDGSMETMCAAPLGRAVYVTTVVAVLLVASLVLSIAAIVPLAALGPLFEAKLSMQTSLLLVIGAWLVLFVFGLIVLAVSAWTRGVVLSAAVAVAFILVMLVLYVATPMVEFLENLNPINLLYWWGSAGIIDSGAAEAGLWIWLAIVGGVSLLVCYLGFLKRDLT